MKKGRFVNTSYVETILLEGDITLKYNLKRLKYLKVEKLLELRKSDPGKISSGPGIPVL